MDASDAHLESALDEYNDKVNQLEASGISPELMEAYVNRGCILSMMEFRTSAMDDLESASDILDVLESQGYEADPGTFVRIHATMAGILFDQGGDCMPEYERAAERLHLLDGSSRHYDRRSIVRTCVDACKNMIDSDCSESIGPYSDKGLSLVTGQHDAWSQNRQVELLDLRAEAEAETGLVREAVDAYAQSIDIALSLMDRGQLEDPEELVMALVMKAEAEADMNLDDLYISDMKGAITVLEGMMDCGRVPDPDVLVRLHHDLAGALMKQGRIEEAEKHLIRAMEVGVNGAGDYIKINTPGGRSA